MVATSLKIWDPFCAAGYGARWDQNLVERESIFLSPTGGSPGPRQAARQPARAAKEPESGTTRPTARGWMGPRPRINLAPLTIILLRRGAFYCPTVSQTASMPRFHQCFQ